MTNPRYFTVEGHGRAVYLTGWHIWHNPQGGLGPGRGCGDSPDRLDFGHYLDFLEERGQNFIRLWRWEQFADLRATRRGRPASGSHDRHGSAWQSPHRAPG